MTQARTSSSSARASRGRSRSTTRSSRVASSSCSAGSARTPPRRQRASSATWGDAEEAFRASKSGRNLLENAPASRGGHPVLRARERPRRGSALRRDARRRRRDRALAPRRITRLGRDEPRGEGSTLDAVIVNRDPKVRGPVHGVRGGRRRLRARAPGLPGGGRPLARRRRAVRRRRPRRRHGQADPRRSSRSATV